MCTRPHWKLPSYHSSAMWSICCRFTFPHAPVFSESDCFSLATIEVTIARGSPQLSFFSMQGIAGAVSFFDSLSGMLLCFQNLLVLHRRQWKLHLPEVSLGCRPSPCTALREQCRCCQLCMLQEAKVMKAANCSESRCACTNFSGVPGLIPCRVYRGLCIWHLHRFGHQSWSVDQFVMVPEITPLRTAVRVAPRSQQWVAPPEQ